MRRILQIGASCTLALLVITCTEGTLTGPHGSGVAALNLSAFAAPGGGVPVESLEITLQRLVDESMALDSVLPLALTAAKGDSAVVKLNVVLRQNPEDFLLSVRAFGGGITWYTGSSPIRIAAGAAAAPSALVVQYVGPGANAARVALAPTDTTAVGGVPFALRAVVYDSGETAISGVPVAYRVSDTSLAGVIYPTPYSATFTGKTGVRDSVWVIAETPTHVKDSTRVHIIPPAAALAKISGDAQSSIVGAALPAPLVVRVLHGLGGGFKGDTVRWNVTAGTATLTAAFSVSDDSGYASMMVTPTAVTVPGGLVVRASVAGLSGSPVTFNETAIGGTIQTVTVTPQRDTIANGDSLQYTAVALDPLGSPVNTTFGWTSMDALVATVSSTGLATAHAGDSTRIIVSAGGVADTAWLYVRALQSITLSPADTTITAVGDFVDLQVSAAYNFGTGGVNIRFTSASPSAATVDRLTGRVNIIGPGDALIVAHDSVASRDSLIRGFAILHVKQATAGIFMSPKSGVTVGVGGQAQVTATAVDANGYPIPGKVFSWDVQDRQIADVTSSGLVTGVAVGTTHVFATLVEGQSAFQDSTAVFVSDNPPTQLRWAFDSITVGEGGSVFVGLSMTTPAPGPLTIEIKSDDDRIAQARSSTVTIPAGMSTTAVEIEGIAIGRAVLRAQDAGGSGQSYSDGLMTVNVVSTDTPSLMLNSDISVGLFKTVQTYVYILDPAPADITVSLSGVLLGVPTTVTILKGNTAAYFNVTGLVPGLGILSASAPGFRDAVSVNIPIL